MKTIDISVELKSGMVRYPSPYLPEVSLTPVATHEKEGRAVHVLTCGTHVSTHVDAPFHMRPDGATLEQIDVSVFIGRARILRFHHRDKTQPILDTDLKKFEKEIRAESRLILNTHWGTSKWGTKEFFTEGPYLTQEASRYLASFENLKLLGMDFPNVDCRADMIIGKPAPNHQILFAEDIVLLENLVSLEKVDDVFFLSALPPKLVGGDGCPCRAVAMFPLAEMGLNLN
jgi:kynurenine formamidase